MATPAGDPACYSAVRARRRDLPLSFSYTTPRDTTRTPGLRRDEVAQRAGISIDWYVRLEQGRSVSPSMATIDALARALCLNTAEHAHLRALAHGPQRHRFVKEPIPATLDRLIGSLNQPAYVTGRRWDLLTWNAAAAELFAFDDLHEAERNILLFVLTDARARSLFGEAWAQEAQRMTAQFRATHDLWAADPAFTDLLDRLQKGCTQFQAWWQAHEVRPSGTGRKLLHHPQRGSLSFEYSTFQANEDPAHKLAIYVPVTT